MSWFFVVNQNHTAQTL